MTLLEWFQVVGGWSNRKNHLWEGYGYFLESHNKTIWLLHHLQNYVDVRP